MQVLCLPGQFAVVNVPVALFPSLGGFQNPRAQHFDTSWDYRQPDFASQPDLVKQYYGMLGNHIRALILSH